MPPLTRRAFLKLTALAGAAATFARLLPGRAYAAMRAVCVPAPGTEVPTCIPMVVGDDCAPAPTETPTLTATATGTETATPTATASATSTPTSTPTAAPDRRVWLPEVQR